MAIPIHFFGQSLLKVRLHRVPIWFTYVWGYPLYRTRYLAYSPGTTDTNSTFPVSLDASLPEELPMSLYYDVLLLASRIIAAVVGSVPSAVVLAFPETFSDSHEISSRGCQL